MNLIPDLLQEAKISAHGESFKVLVSKENHRLGVGYRIDETEFFVELLVKICHSKKVDLEYLTGVVEKLKLMESEGYSLRCEDDNSLYAEKIVDQDNVNFEVGFVSGVWEV